MRNKLLTSTAVGALLAASSYAYAEGITLKVFGGLNFLGDESHDGRIATSSYNTTFTGDTSLIGGFTGVADFDADTGYVFGGAVGYQWDNGLILEVEATYRRNKLDLTAVGNEFGHVSFTPGSTTDFTGASSVYYSSAVTIDGDDSHISAVSLMANAWYEFNLSNDQWRPYVGGGVGIAWLDMHGLANVRQTSSFTPGTTVYSSTDDIGFHGDESGFAWQLGAGMGYEFAPGKQISLDYRFFNGPTMDNVQFHELENDIDYDYSAHNVMIGVRLGL